MSHPQSPDVTMKTTIAVARRGLILLGLSAALAALPACNLIENLKGKGKEGPASSSSASAPGKPGGEAKTNLSGPKDAKGVDLGKVLGTKADGWAVPAFAKLREDMTPAQVGKIIPGAEKIDEYGFAEVKASVRGVASYKLSYQDSGGKKGLKFAEIWFDPKLTDEPFWTALVDHLQKRLAADMTDHGGHHVTWVGPGFTIWSLSKGITHEGYELQIAVGK
jgi:hypothetical protein